MKNLYLLLTALVAISFTSCDNLTEEIYLNEDGSGEYLLYSDMIPSMKQMTRKMQAMFADSTEEISDSLIDAQVWKDFDGEIDSVIDYTKDLPDSILNDPKKKKYITKMEGFMRGGKEKGYVHMGVKYPFDNLNDLEGFLKMVEENQSKGNGQGGPGQAMSGMNSSTEIDFKFKKGTFSRNTKWLEKPELSNEDLAMMQMFMGNGKVTSIIHLPSNAKKVKSDYLKKKDGNTVVLEYDMMDYLTGKIDSDFEIVMGK